MARNIITQLLLPGIDSTRKAEERRKILTTTIFSLVSILMLLGFGVDNLMRAQLPLAVILFSAALVSSINYLYLRITGKYRHTSIVIVCLASVLFVYLFITGGTDNSGYLWLFLLPNLVYFILGLRTGSLFVTALLLLVGVILFIPTTLPGASYNLTLAFRLFSTLIAISIAAFVYEYTREDGRQELLALTEKLDHLSRTDDLTGLCNRRAMAGQIQHEIDRHERNKRPFCLLVADLDYFKRINDQFGHECGDLVLVAVAASLDKNSKKQDIVSRWGGEEFLILLPETTAAQGRTSAERLRQAVEMLAITYAGKTIKVTVSIGITEYIEGQTLDEIIKSADSLLYQAKQSGRNRIV